MVLLARYTVNEILIFATMHLVYSQDFPIVTTPLGKIQGTYLVSHGGNKYKAFQGIPYALSPDKERRFKDPEPAEPWSDVLVANKFREPCVCSANQLNPNVSGVEDCLYLNVYVPTNVTNELLPVIFYIYGGGFQFSFLGGTEQHYLIDHNIIFVSMNYRHASFGFLSTEDNIVSGNMGLKDQALALRWTSENIKHFGGDPKQITLLGFSSGGQSVQYQYLSPMTAGLFQAGISISGTAFNDQAQADNSKAKAIKLGELLKCPTDNISEMVDCLRNRPAYDIASAHNYFQPWHFIEYTPFGPVVEKSAQKPFIDRSPIEIVRSGDVHPIPWITGVTSEDGLYPAAVFALNETIMKDINDNWESIAPPLLNYIYTVPEDQHANVSRYIRQFYFGDKPINSETLLTFTHLLTDRLFIADAVTAAKEQAKAGRAPVWYYYYSYRSNDSLSDVLSNSKQNFGVSHGDDALLVLGNSFIFPNKTTEDFAMHTDLVKFWLSVVYKKEPQFGPEWKKLDSKEPILEYLHIDGPGDFKLKTNDDLGQRKFWESLGINNNKISYKR